MLGSAVDPVTTATLPENGRVPSMERRPLLLSSGDSASPMSVSVTHAASRAEPPIRLRLSEGWCGQPLGRTAASNMAFMMGPAIPAPVPEKSWYGTTTATAIFGSFAGANPIIQSSVFA